MPHLKYSFLSLHCNVFNTDSLQPLPSSRDAAAVFAALRRRKERSRYYGEIASPTLEEATKWLERQAKYLASDDVSVEDAVLVLYVSTHGFESNGDLHLCLRDSSQAKGAQSMLSLCALEERLAPFWEEYPTRRIVLLLQTCRERLVPEQAEESTPEEIWAENQQWSVFFAAKSGGQAHGTEKSFSLRDEDFSVAYGLFTKVFLDKWKNRDTASSLGDLSEEVRHTLQQDFREDAIFVGQKDLIWPPLKKKSPPPPEFRDKRFQSLEKGETLLGRERVLFAALGRWLDEDTKRRGWLETSKDVVCLHGPSGGGKSSLVKAGFLPHLQGVVYADLSKEPFPENIKEDTNIVFLDQIEGFLNETRFEKLVDFLEKAKKKACKTVLMVCSDAEPDLQRLWYAYAPKEWEIDYRVVEVLTETEVEDVIDGSLPADIVQELPNGWRNQLFRTISQVGRGGSPALLQLVLWDLNHTKKLRPLEEIWEEIWKATVKGPLEREMIAVISAFCPLEEGALWQKRRFWRHQDLIEWLSLRDFHTEDIRTALERLLEAHWLTRGQEGGKPALVLTHDLLLPFLAEQLRDDRQERKQRGFARRLCTTLSGVHSDNKNTSLAAHLKEEFAPRELAMLSRHTQFWWQWVEKEALDSSTDIPSQIDFERALEDLLVVQRRKYRQIWQTSATVGFLLLLFGMGWYWKTSVEHRLLSEMEVCTEAPEATLPFHKFQRCSKALVSAENWWWRGRDLKEKTVKLFEAFQAKKVPMEWWKTVPSALVPTRRLLSLFLRSKGGAFSLGWVYLLKSSLQHPSLFELQYEERTALLKLLDVPDASVSDSALRVWKAWLKKGDTPKQQDRNAWLKRLEHPNWRVRLAALEVWKAWLKKEDMPERAAWLKRLQDSNKCVRDSALGVWKAWLKRGTPTQQERAAWLKRLEHPNWRVRLAALGVWRAWLKKGGTPTQQERNAWTTLLQDSDERVHESAVGVWKIWLKKGGTPTQQDRDAWLRLRWVHTDALEVWKAWFENGGTPTQQERDAWLKRLQDSDEQVCESALGVWKAWFEKGTPTQQERDAWLKRLEHPNWRVLLVALEVWKAWLKKGGTPTQQDRAAWLKRLKIWDSRVRDSALGVWKAWLKKGGTPTQQDRAAWLHLLQHSDWSMRLVVLEVWKAWLKKGKAWLKKKDTPTQQERDAWLKRPQDPNEWREKVETWLAMTGTAKEQDLAALGVWKAWLKKGGTPTQQDRAAWLHLLRHSDWSMRLVVLKVWKAWLKKENTPTEQERDAWLKRLQDSNKWVRESALGVWKAWLKRGTPTEQERDAWLKRFEHPNWRVRLVALGVWKAWLKKGGRPTEQERDAWLKRLEHPNWRVRESALGVWKAFLTKTRTPTQQERAAWNALLQDSEQNVRMAALELWKAWIAKTGTATQQERGAWLSLLEDLDPSVRRTALKVWETWIAKTGEATQQERDAWTNMLKNSEQDVRMAALGVWKAWIAKTGEATQQERGAWLRSLQDSERGARAASEALWKAWGRASVLRLFKQETPTAQKIEEWLAQKIEEWLAQKIEEWLAQKIEEWLAQTVAWNEVTGGVKALQARLALDPKLASKLRSSHYPIFQRVAREALEKKAVTPSSRPSTSTKKAPPATSRPSSVRSSQPTTFQPAPIHKP